MYTVSIRICSVTFIGTHPRVTGLRDHYAVHFEPGDDASQRRDTVTRRGVRQSKCLLRSLERREWELGDGCIQKLAG